MKEMVGGCCVCSDERGWPENPLVYCDGQSCTVAVHQACYGIVTVPTGPWYCRKCESQERTTRVRCELCPSRDGAVKRTDNQGWAHVVCALYIPEVRFGNVTTMEPIILQLIPQERYAKTCYICQEIGKPSRANVGACMPCNKSNCKQQFHVTCAQSLGLLCEEAGNYLDNVKYCGYCQHHYSKLKKGGNVKTIPPYKPIVHESTDSNSSPEKEIQSTVGSAVAAAAATTTTTTAGSAATTTTTSTMMPTTSLTTPTIATTTPVAIITTTTTSSTTISGGTTTMSATASSTSATSIKITTTNLSASSSGSSSSTGKQRKSNSTAKQVSASSTTSTTSPMATSAGVLNATNNGSGSAILSSHNLALASNAASSTSNNNSKPSSSSSSSSSYKDKEKSHGKNVGKSSSSSKDKDKDSSSTSSSSSRESRDKSSKNSKNKETLATNNISSSTNNNNNNNGSGTNNATAVVSSTATDYSSSGSNSNPSTILNAASTKDNKVSATTTPIIPTSGGNGGSIGVGDKDKSQFALASNMEVSSGLGNNTSAATASNLITSSSSKTCFPSSNSAILGKKRKAAELKALSNDGNSMMYKDIIKDLSITLTPLAQMDFEKKIEKTTMKKAKTELSPPTHQNSCSDTNTIQNASIQIASSSSGNGATAALSSTTSKILSTTTAASSLVATTTTTHASVNATTTHIPANTTTTTSSSLLPTTTSGTSIITTSSSSSPSNLSTFGSKTHMGSPSASSTPASVSAREERYAAASQAIAMANSNNNNNNVIQSVAQVSGTTVLGSANNNTPPSLCVSVPLSAANVPGINLPANTQVGQSLVTSGAGDNAIMYERHSPHQQQQGHGCAMETSGHVYSSSQSVIHQSGKLSSMSSTMPSNQSVMAAGGNITATATATDNGIKISFEKQTTRVLQLQGQDVAPIRRSRTPDSGMHSNSSTTSTILSAHNQSNLSNNSSCASPTTMSSNIVTPLTTNNSSSSGGLKFCYEMQGSGNQMSSSSGNPYGEEHVVGVVLPVKDSPPSSPESEVGIVRKRGRKSKEAAAAAISAAATSSPDIKEFKSSTTPTSGTSTPPTNMATHAAAHMLGNQINPNSLSAQKLSDQLHMEIQENIVHSVEAAAPQFVSVPFPGKMRAASNNVTTTSAFASLTNAVVATTSATTTTALTTTSNVGTNSLANMFSGGINGIPQSLEQLLERQWEQGSQFLMEQAQHFDIASLLSCLHQLQTENGRLEEHVTSLIARRDHLLAVNARLALPLNIAASTTAPAPGK